MLDITTLSSHKYICELYMDKKEKIHWRKFPVVYLNKQYVYYTVPGKNILEYKPTFYIVDNVSEVNSRFDNWYDRVSYMRNTIKHGGRYYFWDSFVESDEGKEFKKLMKDYHENRYISEEKKNIGLKIDELTNNKNKLLSEAKDLDMEIKELQDKLNKM